MRWQCWLLKAREVTVTLVTSLRSRIFIVYFIVYLAVHSRREIDMAVFEVPL